MKKFGFFLFLMIIPFLGHASHIVGGEFELIHIAGSTYRLNLILYFDLINGSIGAKDPAADVRIFRKSDNFLMKDVNLPLISETQVLYTAIECTIDGLQTSKLLYSAFIELSEDEYFDSQGYYVAWERCCRNYGIDNIYSENPNFPNGTPNPDAQYAGQTFYLEFPAVVRDGEPFIDSTPKLFPPLSDYACVNKPYYVDFAGSDDDGDSLVYSLATPLNTITAGALPPGGFPRPGPYPNVNWQTGFSLNKVMKGNPDLAISFEGLLTVTPTIAGLFAFAIRCEEFRDGIKIGETRRDFQMLAVTCPTTEFPVITGTKPGDPGTVHKDEMDITFLSSTPDDERCVLVDIKDPDALNGDVKVKVRTKGVKGSGGEAILPSITTATINNSDNTATFKICFDKCPPNYNTPYQILIIAADDACAVPLQDTLKINVTVKTPLNRKVEFSAPATNVVAAIKQGAPKVTWPIRAVDPDGDNIVFSYLIDGFDMANVGMKLDYSQALKGTVTGQLTWDPTCALNFSTKENFNITLVADDEDLCGYNRAVMANFNLTVIPPPIPVLTLAQPTCTLATGTITVTIQEPGDTYSFDNGVSFQSSNVKSGLFPGTYQIVIKKGTGCRSVAIQAVINPQPRIPNTPVIESTTQPNCTLATGTINVTPQNNTDSYSFDGGTTFQASNSKAGLIAGTYKIIVKSAGGCSSIGASAIINIRPPAPSTPETSVIQPACVGTTGTITITAQQSGDVYSFDNGLNFQSENSLSELVAGTYSVVIKNSVGCNSIAAPVLVRPVFPVPVPAIISGSPIVCTASASVDYMGSNIQYTYAWFINGGTLKSQQNNKIKVDWGAGNSEAWIEAVATDKNNCPTDTMKYSVKILSVKPTMPQGLDSVCYNFGADVPYQTSNSTGSVYTWFTDGGVISGGQSTHLAQIDWANKGQYKLWVKEQVPAGATFCEGISDTLEVTVFQDLAAITMSVASVDYENENRVQLQWGTALPARLSDFVVVSRRVMGTESWEVIATLNKNVQSFLDQNVLPDQFVYEYKVEGFNKCDEVLQTAVHNTIKLIGEKNEQEELISLSWNEYNGWEEVEQYEIWRKLDDGTDYELLHLNNGNNISYVGKHGSDAFTHKLRIKAKKKGEDTFSWSNEVELTFDNPIVIPNVFTPTGDEKNEYFIISRIHLYPNNQLSIYNSWGKVVYESREYKNNWRADGLASGVYYYSLYLQDSNTMMKGWVQVVR